MECFYGKELKVVGLYILQVGFAALNVHIVFQPYFSSAPVLTRSSG
jgi:hypothetical protein